MLLRKVPYGRVFSERAPGAILFLLSNDSTVLPCLDLFSFFQVMGSLEALPLGWSEPPRREAFC